MSPVFHFWIDFERAWNSHDATAVTRHFEEHSFLAFLDGREFHGISAITEFYSNAFSNMPSGWIHRASIETEAGLTASGIIRILHAHQATEVLSAGYTLELSPAGRILRLLLRKIDSAKPLQRTGAASGLPGTAT